MFKPPSSQVVACFYCLPNLKTSTWSSKQLNRSYNPHYNKNSYHSFSYTTNFLPYSQYPNYPLGLRIHYTSFSTKLINNG
ncbi:hypothetical protein EYC84_001991 [Monilinia fructicola]|uniref:Uncharacterized protein n=1 Tax=Monilinia fructicola TaxID=38448 RepID=A0A5M9JW06_MONFR|nr:hypothetical protein EYC84_001991 [Monilinia fructicola]